MLVPSPLILTPFFPVCLYYFSFLRKREDIKKVKRSDMKREDED